MKRNLIKDTFEIFKKNAGNLILLSALFCLIVCASLAADYLIDGLSFALIIFIVIPAFFGAVAQSYTLTVNSKMDLMGYMRISGLYYRNQFYGSFHLIMSFLKSILIESVLMIVFGSIFYAIYKNNLGVTFTDAVETIMSYLSSGMDDPEYFQEIIAMNDGVLANYMIVVTLFSSTLGNLVFAYFVAYNAIEVHFRSIMTPTNAIFGKRAIQIALRSNKKSILKDFWTINWPLFILALLGAVVGALISLFVLNNLENSLLAAMIGMYVLIIPYFPMYLSSLIVIFNKYRVQIVYSLQGSLKDALSKIIDSPELTEEQKAEANRILDDISQDPFGDSDINDEDGGTKKDPD